MRKLHSEHVVGHQYVNQGDDAELDAPYPQENARQIENGIVSLISLKFGELIFKYIYICIYWMDYLFIEFQINILPNDNLEALKIHPFIRYKSSLGTLFIFSLKIFYI